MKKVYTAKDVEKLLANGDGPEAIPGDAILTPSARDVLRDSQLPRRVLSAVEPAKATAPYVPDNEYKWTPTPEIEAATVNAVFGKG